MLIFVFFFSIFYNERMLYPIFESLGTLENKDQSYINNFFQECCRLDFSSSYTAYGKTRNEYNNYMKDILSFPGFNLHQLVIASSWNWWCGSGNFELITFIMNSKYSGYIGNNQKESGLLSVSHKGDWNIFKYIMKELNFDNDHAPQNILNKCLLNACVNHHFEFAYNLLNSSEIQNHSKIDRIKSNEILSHVCSGKEGKKIIDYLMENKICTHYELIISTHIHEKDNEKELLKYLIFEKEIPYDEIIKNYIQCNENNDLKKMFEARQLTDKLQKVLNLKHKQTKSKI